MILVTGGTGTLGRELVRLLVNQGERVRVMTRHVERAKELPPSVEVALGDLEDDASTAAAVSGCRAVISAAHGFVGPGRSTPERIDQKGNQRLIRAAVAAKVERFVLLSMTGASPDHPMSLARAKFAAEQELRASGLSFCIVRATPFMETWLGILGEMLETKGKLLVFGPGTNPISFVSVRDVAALVLDVLPQQSSEVHEIGGPEAIGFAALAQLLAKAQARPISIEHIPLFALRGLSLFARPFSAAFARQAQAAVVMNTKDMTVGAEWRTRHPGISATTLVDVIAQG